MQSGIGRGRVEPERVEECIEPHRKIGHIDFAIVIYVAMWFKNSYLYREFTPFYGTDLHFSRNRINLLLPAVHKPETLPIIKALFFEHDANGFVPFAFFIVGMVGFIVDDKDRAAAFK